MASTIRIRNESGINDYYIEDTVRLFYQNEHIIKKPSQSTETEDALHITQGQVTFCASGTSETQISIPLGVQGQSKKDFKWDIKRTIYLILSKHFGITRPWGISTGIRPSKIVHELFAQGLSDEDIRARLQSYYLIAADKATLLLTISRYETQLLAQNAPHEVSVYVGIPYCPSICHYCSFSSYPIHAKTAQPNAYIEALTLEAKALASLLHAKGEVVKSIYIGGGTPTSLSAGQLRVVLSLVHDLFVSETMVEFTVEAGRPDTIDEEKLKVLKDYGVTRISINPQTMHAKTLETIGRGHSVQQFSDAFALARKMGFDSINVDLIAGLPGESLEDFRLTLEEILTRDPENITVHALAMKRAAQMNRSKDAYDMTEAALAVAMTDLARKMLAENGYEPYYLYRQKNTTGHQENVGYCKPGKFCIYNVQIMEEKQTIYAIGAGGVTKVFFSEENRVERTFNVKSPNEYKIRINEMILRKNAKTYCQIDKKMLD
ncbi:MAG: coproporphyrinogen dehydrogenase HemZ [Clostridia bacterium]